MSNDIIDLQTRLAFQEDTMQQLNQTVAAQQQQIDKLQVAVKFLIQQLRSLSPDEAPQGDAPEIPPHY